MLKPFLPFKCRTHFILSHSRTNPPTANQKIGKIPQQPIKIQEKIALQPIRIQEKIPQQPIRSQEKITKQPIRMQENIPPQPFRSQEKISQIRPIPPAFDQKKTYAIKICLNGCHKSKQSKMPSKSAYLGPINEKRAKCHQHCSPTKVASPTNQTKMDSPKKSPEASHKC